MTYKYHVLGTPYGGEHTIGTIPKKVAEYWLKQGADAFNDYMFAWDDEKVELNKNIPREFQIEQDWYEIDDIEHICSVEFHDSSVLIVEDAKTGETVAEIEMTDNKLGVVGDALTKAIENDENIYNGEKVIVYGQSFEEGSFTFENLVTDEPFDASKVKLDVTLWDNLKLVHAVCYGNQTLCIENGDTIRKSMAVWIMANIAESTDGSRESALKLIKSEELETEHAADTLKADKEVVLAAVQKDGDALGYAADSFKSDKEVVLAAVQNYGGALEYADDSLKEDEDILEASGKQ